MNKLNLGKLRSNLASISKIIKSQSGRRTENERLKMQKKTPKLEKPEI
jgi:hypothetical protein